METDAEVPVPSTSADSEASPRLGMCEVCSICNAKYTCPRCEVSTCSLKCNRLHKLELECDGQRDKTKFIAMNKFSNLDVTSDYQLLEDISRKVFELQKHRKEFGHSSGRFQPDHLFKLQKAAAHRKVNLKFLPGKFLRRKMNTTRMDFRRDSMLWHVEWIFINADNLKMHDKRVPETEKLSSVLSKYFLKEADERLEFYKSASLSGIKLYLKVEQTRGKKFYELDMSLPLRECLRNKLIIEYPTVHVVLKDHGSGYNVVDSDYEENSDGESKVKTGVEVINSITKSGEDDDNIYESLKNLLFVSEYSDEEM